MSPRADVRAVRRTGRDQSTLPTGFKRSWFTIAAPAKTPKEIIGRLNASVDKFLKTEDGIARLHKLGAEPAGGSAEDMQRYVVAENEKWGKVAKFAGIKPGARRLFEARALSGSEHKL